MTDTALSQRHADVRTWAGFAALCAGMFMAVLDIQIVVTSLSVIDASLKVGADRISWVQTSYLIAEVVAIPLTGFLTRVFSLRWLVTGAVAVFTLASVGCAASTGFAMLVAFRVLQGLAGGVLIPVVFTAVFVLFKPGREQAVATTVAGVIAVMAPALGPICGGLITESLSWHWLFLVNVLPGIATAWAAAALLPRESGEWGLLGRLDVVALGLIALALAALEIGLKEAPDSGWFSVPVLGLLALFGMGILVAARRPHSPVDFSLLRDRNLAYGCVLSFTLGAALFGSVYLLPVFLAYVRQQGPIEIGTTLLVTGVAQLIAAPVSVWLDRRYGARPLAAAGFGLLALGLAASAFETRLSGFEELFWPQVIRGAAVALCILPVTRFALGLLPLPRVGDASALYNLFRNLGGAVGIALTDTLLFTRGAEHAAWFTDLLDRDPATAAAALDLSADELPDPADPLGLMAIMDTLQEASLTLAINEAWLMLAAIACAALPLLWLLGPIRAPDGSVADREGAKF